MQPTICIISSVHSVFDTRIFHKQAKSLVKAGYDVTLIAQHDKNEVVDGVKIMALPRPRNRFWRILGTWRVFKLALKQKADIYHFHDPELLLVGLLLKLVTKGKVIYDVHEDYPKAILTKYWLPSPVRKPVARIFGSLEKWAASRFDRTIVASTAYHGILRNLEGTGKVTDINNYPILSFLKEAVDVKNSRPTIVYVGGIVKARGVFELIETIRLLKTKYENILLTLVGPVNPDTLVGEIDSLLEQLSLKDNVSLVGKVKHEEVYNILPSCHVGVAILHPIPNYLESLPTKLFEYMTVGLPVVASNFPVWQEIVEGNNCGLTVNPLDPEDIAKAIEYLLDNPDQARQMGQNGRKAVMEKYNWEIESKKLLDLYQDLD